MGEYRLAHDTTAAAQARAKIEEELTSALVPDRLNDSLLMVTELVTNAIRHAPSEADGSIVLEIEHEPDVVRIVVRDGGTHMDLDETTFYTQTDGHFGLFVVDELADQWGFSIDGDKGVWFEVEAE